MNEATAHMQRTRLKLRCPPNAVPDSGIDLQRRPRLGFSFVGERPAPIKPPVEIEEIILIYPPSTIVNTQHVIRKVAAFYGLEASGLKGPCRFAQFILPRFVACYLCHEVLRRSYPQIGIAMRRDHTSILSAVKKIKRVMLTDGELASDIAHLEAQLILEMEGA